MANRGPDTNGSQWFITLGPAPHLTGKHVYVAFHPSYLSYDSLTGCRVFGRVISGLQHVQTIGHLPTDEKDRPVDVVTISHCGELELRKPVPLPTKKARSTSASPPRKKIGSDNEEEDDEERERERRRRKEKGKKEKREKKPKEETEAELDAR